MKILFFISSLKAGGAERVLSVVANELCKENKVVIVTLENSESFYQISPQIEQISLDIYQNRAGFGAKFQKLKLIRKCVKEQNPDVVISFMDMTNISVLLACVFLKVPIIISEHSHHSLLASRFWRILRRLTYPFSSALSLLSREDYDYYGFVRRREIIYNPMYFSKSIPLKKEKIILFVGRLERVKGCDRFLKIISMLDKNLIKDYQILVVGDGDERENLQNIAISLGINVQFLGRLQDVSKIYAKSKLLLSTSRIEGLSNVLIEAIYFECARIAIACSGPKELIKDGFDGYLADSESELVQKLEKLLSDDSLIEIFIQNANLKKSEFSAANIASKWQNLIKEVGVK